MGALPPLPLGGPGTQQGHRCLECCGWLSTGLEVKRLAALGDLDPTQQKAESSRLSLPGPCRGEPPSLRRALRSHSTTRTRLKSLHAAPRPLALPSEYPGSPSIYRPPDPETKPLLPSPSPHPGSLHLWFPHNGPAVWSLLTTHGTPCPQGRIAGLSS